ncbi:MAG: hypothetical protein ACI8WB_002263 [Phenylobacterium sp.]|jgi:hypothetical protein
MKIILVLTLMTGLIGCLAQSGRINLPATATATVAQTHYQYPAWLKSTPCDHQNFTFTGLPDNFIHLEHFPPDAYKRSNCDALLPKNSIKPVPTMADAQTSETAATIRSQKLAFLSAQYDLFSWASFITLNRAVNDQFEITQHNLPATGDPVWLNWRDVNSVFLANGEKPKDWDFSQNKTYNPVIADIEQVGEQHGQSSTVLVDQQGKVVYYQRYIGPIFFDSISPDSTHLVPAKKLYNREYQLEAYNSDASGVDLDLPMGFYKSCRVSEANEEKVDCVADLSGYNGSNFSGVVELKAAWKQLPQDGVNNHRYITHNATIKTYQDNDPKQPGVEQAALLGLVGFHINHKTLTSSSWVYSTFSHIDNTETPLNLALSPSFYDLNCPQCQVNIAFDETNKINTQVKLLADIAPITQTINTLVGEALNKDNSVLQYYRLLGTQFTTTGQPLFKHQQDEQEKLVNFARTHPYPTFLANDVIETFLQPGNGDSAAPKWFKNSSCMNCHAKAAIYSGCEVKEGRAVAVTTAGSGDFSFIFTKAQWQHPPTIDYGQCVIKPPKG